MLYVITGFGIAFIAMFFILLIFAKKVAEQNDRIHTLEGIVVEQADEGIVATEKLDLLSAENEQLRLDAASYVFSIELLNAELNKGGLRSVPKKKEPV